MNEKMKKERIYLARTYRHLKVNKTESILFLAILVLPCFVLLLLNYGTISKWVTDVSAMVLQQIIPEAQITSNRYTFIPGLQSIKAISLKSGLPSQEFVLWNIFAVLVLEVISLTGGRKNKPWSIYVAIMLFIHLINCIFFFFAGKSFPYSATEYSELYMKQQIGIWICFLLIIGIVVGILGAGFLGMRIVTFLSVMTYSFLFGLLRYIVFMYVIYKFSMLYMAIFFFALGPFFDFLYLVAIYGIYMDHLAKRYGTGKGKEAWVWS